MVRTFCSIVWFLPVPPGFPAAKAPRTLSRPRTSPRCVPTSASPRRRRIKNLKLEKYQNMHIALFYLLYIIFNGDLDRFCRSFDGGWSFRTPNPSHRFSLALGTHWRRPENCSGTNPSIFKISISPFSKFPRSSWRSSYHS